MGVHAPKKSQNHKAKFIGTSYDIDYDQETQNLCGAPGFLLLGTLVCFILGPHIIFHICCFQALVRLALSQVLSLKVGSLFIVAICCRSFSAMLLGLDSFVRLCGQNYFSVRWDRSSSSKGVAILLAAQSLIQLEMSRLPLSKKAILWLLAVLASSWWRPA